MRHDPKPVASLETATAGKLLVEPTPRGAAKLAASYWHEVEATTLRLVRADSGAGPIDVRLFGRGPALISLGAPTVIADPGSIACSYPILGGLLVGRPGGALTLEQVSGEPVVLRSTLTGYVPRLAGALYAHAQARLHSRISRRYFARLVREAA